MMRKPLVNGDKAFRDRIAASVMHVLVSEASPGIMQVAGSIRQERLRSIAQISYDLADEMLFHRSNGE